MPAEGGNPPGPVQTWRAGQRARVADTALHRHGVHSACAESPAADDHIKVSDALNGLKVTLPESQG